MLLKLQLIWNILLGHSVMYRCEIEDGKISCLTKSGRMLENTLRRCIIFNYEDETHTFTPIFDTTEASKEVE